MSVPNTWHLTTGCLNRASSRYPTDRASGDGPSFHSTDNDHGLPKSSCRSHVDTPICLGHPWSYPPPLPSSSAWTGKMLSGQSTDQTMWRCDMELKLPCCNVRCICWTAAHADSIDCLMFSLAPRCQFPLSDVWISPTLVNRPTCLYLIAACNYGIFCPTCILG